MLTNAIVKRLPQADMIIALNSAGQIIQQGTFPELNIAGTYIHRLHVIPEVDSTSEEKDDEAFTAKIGRRKSQINPKSDDSSRKTGDLTIYKYYIRALGPLALFLFVLLIAVHEAFAGLGSKLRSLTVLLGGIN
jgi:hypothetical protein